MILSRENPHYFPAVNAENLFADFIVTVEEDFPNQAINASWVSVSGCTITNVIVESTREIDGINYENVVIGRFSGMTGGIEAVSTLQITGVDSSEVISYDIRIPSYVPS